MLVRSLLAVLTLLGVVPLRLCTCGAAHIHHHHSPIKLPTERGSTPKVQVSDPQDDGPVHGHDCSIHKARAAMPLAIPTDVTDAEADDAVAFFTWGAGEVVPGLDRTTAKPRPPDPPHTLHTPLFITLRALRN